MKLPLIVFSILLLLIILSKWRASKPKKEKVEVKLGWVVGIVMLAIMATGGWYGYKYITNPKPVVERDVAVAKPEPVMCGATVDFTTVELPPLDEKVILEVHFRQDCWTNVTLPDCASYRDDYSADAEIVFVDGAKYINGPGRHTWYGVHKGKMRIKGLREAGVVKFYLERRT